ncbi:MAG TPA: 2-oxo-4-hydroxy-4-carboxy-5-ureidoimidazoline decarboxylase [Thermoanaerobaculia bacterium]|nr:2-oxo-4-hydroxy-4-carboxy-5-ureidoimidazoline decarboxylase [Thermoanaerobaculia bacterium]
MNDRAALARFNALPPEAAERELLDCCGAWRWARRLAAARPYAGAGELAETAERAFAELEPLDWMEAFAAHPRIGDAARAGAQSARGESWSAGEQAGVRGADESLRAALAAGNRDYEAKFGYTFIVCATGRSGEEMLAELERRLGHEPERELETAAAEQRRITQLRLGRLFGR